MAIHWRKTVYTKILKYLESKPERLDPGEKVTKSVKTGISFTLFRQPDPTDLTLYARFHHIVYKGIDLIHPIGEYSENGEVITLFDN